MGHRSSALGCGLRKDSAVTVTAQSFRSVFPEFSNVAIYPDEGVAYWIGIAYRMLPEDRWADMLDHGVMLYTAHNLALGAANNRSASGAGIPGQSVGVLSSKTVDKVSASYDTGAGTIEGAGDWNLTTYGIRFRRLGRMFGAGGVQL